MTVHDFRKTSPEFVQEAHAYVPAESLSEAYAQVYAERSGAGVAGAVIDALGTADDLDKAGRSLLTTACHLCLTNGWRLDLAERAFEITLRMRPPE